MPAVTVLTTQDRQSIIKLIEWGLRPTTIQQVLGDAVHKEVITQLVKEYNPTAKRQGRTQTKPLLDTYAKRMLSSWICLQYRYVLEQSPSAPLLHILTYLYEQAYSAAQTYGICDQFTIDEVYATIVAYNNGILRLVQCRGSINTAHQGHDFEFVVQIEEPMAGRCPWCMLKRHDPKPGAVSSNGSHHMPHGQLRIAATGT